MNGQADKTLSVDGVEYIIDESADIDIVTLITEIEDALTKHSVAKVSVLDAKGNPLTLFLNGGQVGSVAIGTGEGPRPGEISPKSEEVPA